MGIEPVPPASEILEANSRAYNSLAYRYVETWRDGTLLAASKSFKDAMPTGRPSRVLDLACGPGLYWRDLGKDDALVVGLDLSREMLRHARPRYAHVVQADAVNLPFRDGFFSGVWFSAGLVHVPPLFVFATIQGIGRILSAGGAAYISFQRGHGIMRATDGRIFFFHSEDLLLRAAGSARLSVVKSWQDVSTGSTTGGKRIKRWSHMLLRRS